jgi:hypothetical protein
MELLEQGLHAPQDPFAGSPATTELDERAARRSLRHQIARLERELAQAFVTAYRMGGIEAPAQRPAAPRVLDLGALERIRDELAQRLHEARVKIAERAEIQAANRLALERMLLEPGKYRFARIAASDIGEPGCGVWQVRPRLGLIGMLMGWWEVKLSSGCPLGRGHGRAPGPAGRSILSEMRAVLRNGAGGVLVVMIMLIGSLGLWIGTPLLWLWVGSQVQGATQSLGTAFATAFGGAVATVVVLAWVLAKLSDVYRENRLSRGRNDTGHVVLEVVLVVSAGLTVAAFLIWFFLLSGANPVPVDISI